ncbi:sigma-70 family RNA polymerase sigma factor [Rhodobacteraceae bacterium NNCM2]|nr:sigma-70 family RNA polymerase sigma factor [Coraliihabitans acroporae]
MLDQGTPDENAELVIRFAAGDHSAARTLTERLVPAIIRQAWRILGDQEEAEDVAQEVMMKLWKQAATWRVGEAKVTTWIYRVTQNLCIDRLRRKRPTTDIDQIAEPEDGRPSVLDGITTEERNRGLAAEIDQLPDRQREALLLRHFEELSNPAIAERLDCTVEAVESLLARARRQLAKRLTRNGERFDNV